MNQFFKISLLLYRCRHTIISVSLESSDDVPACPLSSWALSSGMTSGQWDDSALETHPKTPENLEDLAAPGASRQGVTDWLVEGSG